MKYERLLRIGFGIIVGTAIGTSLPSQARASDPPQAIEVTAAGVDLLPGGKEADGIIGDFVLRNDLVEAVISHNAPHRKANMSTFWGDGGETPGCLYDLTLRGSDNDQITIFSPLKQRGPVSYVRVVDTGSSEAAAVETVISAGKNGGRAVRHEYRVTRDWPGVVIRTAIENATAEPMNVSADDEWTRFRSTGKWSGVHWADAIDPADRAGYAYHRQLPDNGDINPDETLPLAPGASATVTRFLAVGRSPAEAVGQVLAKMGTTGRVSGRLIGPDNEPVSDVTIQVRSGSDSVPLYPDHSGAFSLQLPPGDYEFAAESRGRTGAENTITVSARSESALTLRLGPLSGAQFQVTDSHGRSIPCKVQFVGLDGANTPNLGPGDRAHGCADQYHSEHGRFFVALDPGRYQVTITRGIEYGHHREEIEIAAGNRTEVRARLARLVDTRGWVSADFHNHSTPSGDNTCGTDDRLINLAAEHIEFAPTTEHNRFYDWAPHIEKLGLKEHLNTIPGIELTGSGAHLNAFPFEPQPRRQDGGAPLWVKDPRINAIVLRDYQTADPHRWIQINHPDMVENFIDRDGDGRIDGGFLGLGRLIDGLETQNYRTGYILSGAPFRITGSGDNQSLQMNREFIWLQLLNQGHTFWGVAVSDAHAVYGNGVGGWRTYIPSATDLPEALDWKEITRNAKAGNMVLTTGPFLRVQAGDGTGPGGSTRASGSVRLNVHVQCSDWIDIDRIQVLVNGRQEPALNFTRDSHPDWFGDGVTKFDRTIDVPLSRDSHLIVVAYGENFDLSTGYGTSPQSNLKPCAYHNPIFVDTDGGGFEPSLDLLGYPLPTKGLSVEEARALLK